MRKQVQMSEEIATWYEEQADKMGISVSSLMVIALKQYKDQQETLKEMSGLPELIKRLEELKKITE